MKLLKPLNPTPEKGVLLILRIGTMLQTVLLFIFLISAAIEGRTILPEISSLITLTVSLIAEGSLLWTYDKTFPRLKKSYLPILIAFQSLISITLPLLFTSQLNIAEFYIGFWVMIPAAFIPISIVGLQYNYFATFFYSLFFNLFDFLVMTHIFTMQGNDFTFVFRFIQEHQLFFSYFLRFIFMIMMGHIISVMVSSIRSNEKQLSEANSQLEKLNQHLEERVLERTQLLETTNQKTLEGWVRLMELRRLEPTGHTTRMQYKAKAFAIKLGLDYTDKEILQNTILLHDVGKLGIPDRILLKSGALTEQEFAQSKLHVEYGVQILQGIDFLKPCLHVIAAHHERWDGSGYPRGLSGKDIPFLARVFSVLEVYDVMTHDTVYRRALTKAQTRKHLVDNSGILYDPLVITQFIGLLETQSLDDFASHL